MKMYYSCLIALLLTITGQTNAQVNFIDQGDDHSSAVTASNEKAVTNFQKSFSEVTEVKWQTTKTGSRVCFTQHNWKCTATYNCRGKWESTIKRTDGEHISAETRRLIDNFYPGYSAMYEMYVENWQGAVVLTKIENKTHCKTLRIVDNQYDIIEEFGKI